MSENDKVGLFTMAWFKPLWRRVAVLVVILGWAGFEWFYNHDQFWGFVTLAMLAYAIWTFFINFETELKKAGESKPDGKPKD